MKTSNWSQIKKPLYYMAITMMVLSSVACGSKSEKKSSIARQHRNDGFNNQNIDPRTGQVSTEWGEIYGFNDQALRGFMYNVTDLGTVSSNQGANTGIRFRTNKTNNTIEMLVWDSVASQTGQAFFWALQVTSQRGSPIVTAQDSDGMVTFNGQNLGGVWRGTVQFSNSQESGGAQGPLGSFIISASEML